MTLGPVIRETGEPFGSPDVRLVCACGWSTLTWATYLEHEAEDEMRGHLADEHGDELGVGRCANCRRPTDHLRMVAPGLGDDAWLCESCAPNHQLEKVIPR